MAWPSTRLAMPGSRAAAATRSWRSARRATRDHLSRCRTSPAPAVSPSRDDRDSARRIADDAFREVYVATPAEICESRDPKGHYAKARAGTLKGFTGIGNDYEPPASAELTLDTSIGSATDAADEIERMLAKTGILFDELADLAANI